MKPTGFLPRAASLLLVTVLGGCEVGPAYHAPAAPVVALTPAALPAATQAAAGVSQNFISGADITGDWWTLYHSPELNALITTALAHNPTLNAAQGTLLEAQETVREAEGVLVPTISGSLQAERVRNSAAQFAGQGTQNTGVVPPYSLYNATLSLSYSLDIWGGARRELESLSAQEQYQRYELEAAYLSLTANIVTEAVTEASLNAQITDTQSVIAAERHELSILQTQVTLGGVSPANVLSQQATLAASEATLPPLQSQLAQARNQLATYVGSFPGDFHENDFTLADLHLPAELPVSLPSSILAQRPDIAAAAAQLHEASANIGVADANMLPQITLSASVGHESLTTGTLFTPQTLLWTLVSGLTQPIFEGGQLAAKRKIALAALRVSGAQYQGIVLTAFQNVADALQILQYDAITLNAAQAAADAAGQSLSVTENQYQLGAQPFTAVLTAQTSYQNAAITQVKASATRLADTAALYQALGGGWWHRSDVQVSCCGIIP